MLSENYALAVKRLPDLLTTIQSAGVPAKFTHEFLKTLGFKSTNDRSFISVLKGIGFLDDGGVPTDVYKAYRNRSAAKTVLANVLRTRYEDLFLANENVHTLSIEKIKGIFATKTGKGDSVVEKMASTFKTLASQADFNTLPIDNSVADLSEQLPASNNKNLKEQVGFHYNIQVHLPATQDISVYNAIFKSIREHLL